MLMNPLMITPRFVRDCCDYDLTSMLTIHAGGAVWGDLEEPLSAGYYTT